MSDDTETLLLLALAVWAFSKLGTAAPEAIKKANVSLQQGGSRIYDLLHPGEKEHTDHLPGKQMTRAQLLKLVTDAGFVDPNMAVAVILAESGGVPNAIGDGGLSIGLFQINTRAWGHLYEKDKLADPIYNAQAALHISKGGSDWRHWSVFKSGRYKNFLQ